MTRTVKLNRFRALDRDRFGDHRHRFLGAAELVVGAVRVQALAIEILDVGGDVGRAPRDEAVAAERDGRVPGNVPPITSKPGADMCARYHVDGSLVPRCGSLASSGLAARRQRAVGPPSCWNQDPRLRAPVRKSRTTGSPCETAESECA